MAGDTCSRSSEAGCLCTKPLTNRAAAVMDGRPTCGGDDYGNDVCCDVWWGSAWRGGGKSICDIEAEGSLHWRSLKGNGGGGDWVSGIYSLREHATHTSEHGLDSSLIHQTQTLLQCFVQR